MASSCRWNVTKANPRLLPSESRPITTRLIRPKGRNSPKTIASSALLGMVTKILLGLWYMHELSEVSECVVAVPRELRLTTDEDIMQDGERSVYALKEGSAFLSDVRSESHVSRWTLLVLQLVVHNYSVNLISCVFILVTGMCRVVFARRSTYSYCILRNNATDR